MHNPKIIIIFGPPGAGKDTQAERIAKRFGLFQFITSSFIQKELFNPAKKNDKIIKKQLKLYNSGKWNDPRWVLNLVKNNVKKLHKANRSIVFTASPRTMFEAKGMIPLLESLYGKDSIRILQISIKDRTSIFRITRRRFCENCKHTLVYSPHNNKLKKCPKCGGKIITRALDTKALTIKRLKEYKNRTLPVLKYLQKRGCSWTDIDGEPLPDEVTKQIFKKLEPLLKND